MPPLLPYIAICLYYCFLYLIFLSLLAHFHKLKHLPISPMLKNQMKEEKRKYVWFLSTLTTNPFLWPILHPNLLKQLSTQSACTSSLFIFQSAPIWLCSYIFTDADLYVIETYKLFFCSRFTRPVSNLQHNM